jgi:putative intracellular protease/amidase
VSKRDAGAQRALATTVKLSNVVPRDFDAVFYPGGRGPLWDLAEDKHSIALIESTHAAGKSVALVCHAPGVLRNAKVEDGSPLVKGKRVTGFSDTEEEAVQLTKIVPFLVEDELKRLGGLYAKGPDWTSFVQVAGNLIPGDYFKHLCRLIGVELRPDMKLPQYFGHLTNDLIWKRIAPGLLRTLKERRSERGSPSNKLHSWASEELGKSELLLHLGTVVGLMKIHTDYDTFHKQLNAIAPIYPDEPGLFDDPKNWEKPQ